MDERLHKRWMAIAGLLAGLPLRRQAARVPCWG